MYFVFLILYQQISVDFNLDLDIIQINQMDFVMNSPVPLPAQVL